MIYIFIFNKYILQKWLFLCSFSKLWGSFIQEPTVQGYRVDFGICVGRFLGKLTCILICQALDPMQGNTKYLGNLAIFSQVNKDWCLIYMNRRIKTSSSLCWIFYSKKLIQILICPYGLIFSPACEGTTRPLIVAPEISNGRFFHILDD